MAIWWRAASSTTACTGRHGKTFQNPAIYLALVAGDLKFVEDYFVTCSGRRITLRIYVEAKDLAKCSHAMSSLKRAMAWDEKSTAVNTILIFI